MKKWPDDWYRISDSQVQNIGGNQSNLFNICRSWPFVLLQLFVHKSLGFSFPRLLIGSPYVLEYKWKIWKFERVPQSFWIDKNNQIMFFREIGEELGVKTFEDWYKVKQVSKKFD